MRRRRSFDDYDKPFSGKTETVRFDSWPDAIEYAKRQSPHKAVIKNGELESRNAANDSWAGASFDGAIDLMFKGWDSEGERAIKLSQAIFTRLANQVFIDESVYDVTGVNLDIAAFINGEPEHWQRYEQSLSIAPGKLITIVVNGFYSSGVSNDAIIARGATLTALIQLLEYAGIRTKVVLHTPFENHAYFIIPVKQFEDELNIARLMFATGHPSMFRRISFSMYEQHPNAWRRYYGRPYELPVEYRGDIYIPCMGYGDPQWTNAETAQAWIIENLKKQGVDVR